MMLTSFSEASIDFKDLPKGCAVNGVKSLCKINKDNIQRLMLLCCLLLKLAQSEDHVRSGATLPESTLTLRENFFRNELQPVQDNLGKDFTSYGQ